MGKKKGHPTSNRFYLCWVLNQIIPANRSLMHKKTNRRYDVNTATLVYTKMKLAIKSSFEKTFLFRFRAERLSPKGGKTGRGSKRKNSPAPHSNATTNPPHFSSNPSGKKKNNWRPRKDKTKKKIQVVVSEIKTSGDLWMYIYIYMKQGPGGYLYPTGYIAIPFRIDFLFIFFHTDPRK